MKISNVLFSLMLPLAGVPTSLAMGQDHKADITEGKFAKIAILSDYINAGGAHISPDGKYAGGNYVEDGFIYDLTQDSAWITAPAQYIVSPQLYAGNGVISRNGQQIAIETFPADSAMGGGTIWAATPDLEVFYTMSFENESFTNGRTLTVNYAYRVDGKSGEILEKVTPHWPFDPDGSINDFMGFGERVNVVSHDGKILAGHSADPKGLINMSPVIWDLQSDTSLAVVDGGEGRYGTIESMNNDGSILFVTFVDEGVYMVRYDREKVSYELEKVPLTPGMTYGFVGDVSETGFALLMQQTSMADYGSREAYIYRFEDQSLILLEDYLRELYGLEVPFPLYAISSVSDDGHLMGGYLYSNVGKVPFVITLGEDQLHARPLDCQARQSSEGMTVTIRWTAPLKGKYELAGYNVFCDSVQINTELIPQDQLSFTQTAATLQAGRRSYMVQAVYTDGEVSDFSDAFDLMVVSESGCYPVGEISNKITYNRYVDIFWGFPAATFFSESETDESKVSRSVALELSDKMGSEKKTVETESHAKSYTNEDMDVVTDVRLVGYTWSSAFVKDEKVYMSDYANNRISVFDYPSLKAVGQYEVEGVSKITNMSVYGNNIYVASDADEVRVVDMGTMTVNNRMQADSAVRNICYVPTLDGGKGGFVYGSWLDLHYANRFFQPLEVEHPIDITGMGISGIAYYDGYLYLFSQSGASFAEVIKADIETGEILARKDLSEDLRLADIAPGYDIYAGGMCASVLPDSTVVLMPMLQFQAENSHLLFMELESAPNLLGYNLYRNGEKLNPDGEYLQGHHFSDEIREEGTYVYQVETVTTSGCTNMLDEVKTEVLITAVGECPGPKDLQAYESGLSVVLEWGYEAGVLDPALEGYDIYRNNELISDKYFTERYIDSDLEPGTYIYRVETYHINSCIGVDSVEVVVDNQGQKMPPTSLDLTVEGGETFDVTASWNLPYFEEPLPMGYGNVPLSGIVAESGSPVSAVIGWDSAMLAPYGDYYVVGMEFFIGDGVTSIDALVYLNDTLAYRIPFNDRIRESEWNTILFNTPITMKQDKELVIGYEVSYEGTESPAAIYDFGPATDGYGNLLSVDGGQNWLTLTSVGVDANWCINALVVRSRDLETGKDGSFLYHGEPVVMKRGQDAAAVKLLPLGAEVKASSSSVKLLGFNVYRDGEKLNEEVLNTFSFVDENVPEGFYEYSVSAVYGDDDEISGDPEYIDLTEMAGEGLQEAMLLLNVYPNPATDWVGVKGDYSVVDIYTVAGVHVARHQGLERIPLSGLQPGVYMFNFTLFNGSHVTCKVVVR